MYNLKYKVDMGLINKEALVKIQEDRGRKRRMTNERTPKEAKRDVWPCLQLKLELSRGEIAELRPACQPSRP